MEINQVDFVLITDHNNSDYKYFEDDKIFAGEERNTEDGRLLLLGNKIPVISHPNNFEFEHYRWKGEFKKDYLYEIINIKDIIVWNKLITGLALIKNLLIFPITRNIIHKWNSLIPADKWIELYFNRAKGLKIIGGTDLHIKVVYQERTHGLMIPSYKSGFKWLINVVYSKIPIENKDQLLNALKNGNMYISLKQNFFNIWAEKDNKIYILGEEIPLDSNIYFEFNKKKKVAILKKDNIPVLITEKDYFKYKVEEKGDYHLELYEYDFKLFGYYFGFRLIGITNFFKVV